MKMIVTKAYFLSECVDFSWLQIQLIFWVSFIQIGGTDGQTRFRNPRMETCRKTKNFNSKLKIKSWLSIAIMNPRMTRIHNTIIQRLFRATNK